MHMSNALCFKFQVPASNTLGGVAQTRTVLKSVTNVRMYVRMYVRIRVKLYAPPHFVAGAKNHSEKKKKTNINK